MNLIKRETLAKDPTRFREQKRELSAEEQSRDKKGSGKQNRRVLIAQLFKDQIKKPICTKSYWSYISTFRRSTSP